MRLICIPYWLANVVAVNKLPATAYVNDKELAPFVSRSDLNERGHLTYEIGEFLEKRLGLPMNTLRNIHPTPDEPSIHWSNDSIEFVENHISPELQAVVSSGQSMVERLAGRSLPQGYGLIFKARLISGPWEEPTVGVFALVEEIKIEEQLEKDKQFLSDLVELFYAHHAPICRVAKHPLVNAFINGIC